MALVEVPVSDKASGNGNSQERGDTKPSTVVDEAKELVVFAHRVNKENARVDVLEQKVNKVAEFFSSLNRKHLSVKEIAKQTVAIKKQQQATVKREAVAAKRMQELMRQFRTLFRRIMAHDLAWPFMDPVDVEGLGLHDYYEVIDKPMDFGTITKKMEAKDSTGYKNVQEMCADVRLVLKNAMKYNNEGADVHDMARSLLDKFEEKWLQLLPKVMEEEKRRNEEEAEAQRDNQVAQEVANVKLARELSSELYEVDMQLDELRETVVKKCRKMSVVEKIKLGSGLSRLSPEDFTKAHEIIAQNNPKFEATAKEIEIDMDAQSELTLWRLKFFIKKALEVKSKVSPMAKVINNNAKRKRELCDARAQTAKSKKPFSSANILY